MKNELDYLQNNILKAMAISSVFSFTEIKGVYLAVASFDLTIDVLKCAVENGISLETAIDIVLLKNRPFKSLTDQ